MPGYSMGIDFGTLSARAVLIDIETGAEMASSVCEYAHGVMAERLEDGTELPPDYALQHPGDYLEALYYVTGDCIEKAGVDATDIIGVGVDFTSSTILPVTEDGTPLCFLEAYKNNPHAYVKLWKHHAAQKEADEINALAKETGASWLKRYGGSISCEWMFPKVLQILREDAALYEKTFRFIEAGDWIVWQLTGKETHSVCTTGFKAIWDEESGYPDGAFLKRLDPRLETVVGDKIADEVIKLSGPAGTVSEGAAQRTGLREGTPVMPAFIDAHAALPAQGVTKPGGLLLIIGTSTCHILLSDTERAIPGISGYVKDGIVDGLYAYEAGQACVGDSFDWFVKNCVPKKYYDEAEKQGVNMHAFLRSKAEGLAPGAGGILALDWWNGNRTPYGDENLSGLIVGLTLRTKPEEIYRALIEATAFGTKQIIEIYENSGIEIREIYAAGGIAEKDALLMQIYADVTGRKIRLSGTGQACALGSAVLGAANKKGHGSLHAAAAKMKCVSDIVYKPNAAYTEKYDVIYEKYKELSRLFAENEIMEHLKVHR